MNQPERMTEGELGTAHRARSFRNSEGLLMEHIFFQPDQVCLSDRPSPHTKLGGDIKKSAGPIAGVGRCAVFIYFQV